MDTKISVNASGAAPDSGEVIVPNWRLAHSKIRTQWSLCVSVDKQIAEPFPFSGFSIERICNPGAIAAHAGTVKIKELTIRSFVKARIRDTAFAPSHLSRIQVSDRIRGSAA